MAVANLFEHFTLIGSKDAKTLGMSALVMAIIRGGGDTQTLACTQAQSCAVFRNSWTLNKISCLNLHGQQFANEVCITQSTHHVSFLLCIYGKVASVSQSSNSFNKLI